MVTWQWAFFFIPHSFSGLSTLLRPLHQYEKFQIDAIPPSVQVKCITWNSNFESCLLFMYYVWNAFFECMTSHYVSVCILYEINVLVSLHNFSFSVDVKNRYQACVVHGELIKWKMWPLQCTQRCVLQVSFPLNLPQWEICYLFCPYRPLCYYYGSNKSTRKETGETHLCAVSENISTDTWKLQTFSFSI